MSVAIGPGMISRTRMPNGASSARRLSPTALDRGLARPVRRVERHRGQDRRRRHVAQHAAAARPEQRDRPACHLDEPEHVRGEHRLPQLRGRVLERRVRCLGPRRCSRGPATRRAGRSSPGPSRRGPPGAARRPLAAACSGSAAPAAGWRIVATVSKPRAASSSATARPIPRLAPVTTATPSGSIRSSSSAVGQHRAGT